MRGGSELWIGAVGVLGLLAWHEDFEDIRVAEERLADLHAGRSRTYTLDEVVRELGLAD